MNNNKRTYNTTTTHSDALERDLGKFIKQSNIEVIDVKFSTCVKSQGQVGYSALILYEEIQEEEDVSLAWAE